MKNLGTFCLLLLLVFSSCRQDEKIITIDEFTPPPVLETFTPEVSNVTAGLIGIVVNEYDEPVADATVTINNSTMATDQFGQIFIENMTLNELGALVKVEKAGYFDGSRRFFPIEGEQSRVKIQLLEKKFDFNFQSESGGNVVLSSGAVIAFSANSIVDASGNPHSGNVKVAAKWMDPSSLATLDQMPGNLQGVNKSEEEVALATYGMLAVELEGDAGQALNIAEGSMAEITMPVPASILDGAPSEIPLWSYHEDLGLWVEESKATLQGANYVGKVSHFSFWNCDIPFPLFVNLKMTLVDENGWPLSNYFVKFTAADDLINISTSGSGYSNERGNISGPIPRNTVLTMEVLEACGNIIYTQEIGPFDTNTNLGDITVNAMASGADLTIVKGKLLDCNGAPVNNGIISVNLENGKVLNKYLSTSDFSFTLPSCEVPTIMDVIAVNQDLLEQSNVFNIESNTTTDLGNINVCGIPLENYFSLTIDGETKVAINANVDTFGIATLIFAEFSMGSGNNSFIDFSFYGHTVGDYSDDTFFGSIYFNQPELYWLFEWYDITYDDFLVTQYDNNIVIGSYSGQALQDDGSIVPISCKFNIRH